MLCMYLVTIKYSRGSHVNCCFLYFVQVKGMYWQACLVVLIVAVFNPSTIGRFVWENIPSLRRLMEVLITGCRMSQSNR